MNEIENNRLEKLRTDILQLPFPYQQIAEEAGIGGKNGEGYVRKFASGVIQDLTTTRFFALERAVKRLERRGAPA